LLKVALTTAVLAQTEVEASGGVTEITVGGVRGSPAFPGPLSGSPHPARRTANRNAKNAEIQFFLAFNLRIRFSSSSLTSDKAFNAAMNCRTDTPIPLQLDWHGPCQSHETLSTVTYCGHWLRFVIAVPSRPADFSAYMTTYRLFRTGL
jgi:hypothetical protein